MKAKRREHARDTNRNAHTLRLLGLLNFLPHSGHTCRRGLTVSSPCAPRPAAPSSAAADVPERDRTREMGGPVMSCPEGEGRRMCR